MTALFWTFEANVGILEQWIWARDTTVDLERRAWWERWLSLMETIRQDKTERWVLTDYNLIICNNYCVCMARACNHSSVRLRGQLSGCSSMNASPVNAHASGPDHACPCHLDSQVNAHANMPAQCMHLQTCQPSALTCFVLNQLILLARRTPKSKRGSGCASVVAHLVPPMLTCCLLNLDC